MPAYTSPYGAGAHGHAGCALTLWAWHVVHTPLPHLNLHTIVAVKLWMLPCAPGVLVFKACLCFSKLSRFSEKSTKPDSQMPLRDSLGIQVGSKQRHEGPQYR